MPDHHQETREVACRWKSWDLMKDPLVEIIENVGYATLLIR
jgi:hypothetical protein